VLLSFHKVSWLLRAVLQVDLKQQFPSTWQRTDVLYGQLLDICRYFVVWYPLIIGVVQGEFYVLGLH